MPNWLARPIIRGRPSKDHLGELTGNHKTERGRAAYIRLRGKPGVTYAVAVRLDTGWQDVSPVVVPRGNGA
jgi:hypothetical protein